MSRTDMPAVWDLFASSFAGDDLTVHRIKSVSGPGLAGAGLMQQHYGVITQISRLGRPARTEAAEKSLSELRADAPEDTEVLGGHQFLERFAEISPFALAMLFSHENVPSAGSSQLVPSMPWANARPSAPVSSPSMKRYPS